MAINLNIKRVRQAQKYRDRAGNLLLSILPYCVWTRKGNTEGTIPKTKNLFSDSKLYQRRLKTLEMDSSSSFKLCFGFYGLVWPSWHSGKLPYLIKLKCLYKLWYDYPSVPTSTAHFVLWSTTFWSQMAGFSIN